MGVVLLVDFPNEILVQNLALRKNSFQQNLIIYSDVSRVFLGRPVPPPPLFLNLVPPDALKMHSLVMPVLRFLCETFSKLRKLNNKTLFSVDV